MKGLCKETQFMVEKILPPAGLEPGTARSTGQHLPTKLPGSQNEAEGLVGSIREYRCMVLIKSKH